MASYGMYNMNPQNFGGGLMDWLPNAQTAMQNANAASDFIYNMQQRRAASEALPMRLWADQNKSIQAALEAETAARVAQEDISQAEWMKRCSATPGSSLATCQAEYQRQKQGQQTGMPAQPAPTYPNSYSPSMGIIPNAPQANPYEAPNYTQASRIAGLYASPATPQNNDLCALGKTLFGGV